MIAFFVNMSWILRENIYDWIQKGIIMIN